MYHSWTKAEEVHRVVAERVRRLTTGRPDAQSERRANLARLRRGVGREPGEMPEVWEITLADLPEDLVSHDGVASPAEQAIHGALTLFALHQQGKEQSVSYPGVSFGAAVRRLVDPDPNRSNEQTIKRRFDAALTAKGPVEFARHARGLIQLMRAHEVVLDYPKFARDLYCYQDPDQRIEVMRRWGVDFWAFAGKARKQEKDQGEDEEEGQERNQEENRKEDREEGVQL